MNSKLAITQALENLIKSCKISGKCKRKDLRDRYYCDAIIPTNRDKFQCEYLGESRKFELNEEQEYYAGFGESLCECKRGKK